MFAFFHLLFHKPVIFLSNYFLCASIKKQGRYEGIECENILVLTCDVAIETRPKTTLHMMNLTQLI